MSYPAFDERVKQDNIGHADCTLRCRRTRTGVRERDRVTNDMAAPDHDEVIPILDFGSQYAQLIARRVREKGVYSELVRPNIAADELKKLKPRGIILSGGPNSVYEEGAPRCDPKIFDLGVPILGICYGLQI